MKTLCILAMLALCCHGDVLKFEQHNIMKKVITGLKMQDTAQSIIKDALQELGDQEEDTAGEEEQNEIAPAPAVAASVQKPWFCHKLNCPEYTVISNGSDYELREYVPTSWVSTTMTGVDLDDAMSKMFMKLFAYISGANELHQKIAMTTPVIIRIIPGQGPACENNFTMSFFNVKGHNPPAPTASDVTLTTLPSLRAYVRSFGGWASEKTYIEEAKKLADSLPASASYVKDFYYSGGYDAPFTIFNRHNEIWFIAQ